MSRTTLRDAALAYARRGWPVFEVHRPLAGGRCSCRRDDCTSVGKHPRGPHGSKDATHDLDRIHQWWTARPWSGIGIPTGAVSGLVALDVDRRHDGYASLARLVAGHGPLPPTYEVATGGGGRHYYYAHPGGRVPCSAGRLGEGLDVRGDGGSLVAPPSFHASGHRYRVVAARPVAPLPEWLLELARPAVSGARLHRPDDPIGVSDAYARAAVEGECARVRTAVDGTRNDTLNRAAFALGQLVAAGVIEEHQVLDALTAAAEDCGLGHREAAARSAAASAPERSIHGRSMHDRRPEQGRARRTCRRSPAHRRR